MALVACRSTVACPTAPGARCGRPRAAFGSGECFSDSRSRGASGPDRPRHRACGRLARGGLLDQGSAGGRCIRGAALRAGSNGSPDARGSRRLGRSRRCAAAFPGRHGDSRCALTHRLARRGPRRRCTHRRESCHGGASCRRCTQRPTTFRTTMSAGVARPSFEGRSAAGADTTSNFPGARKSSSRTRRVRSRPVGWRTKKRPWESV